MDSGILVRLIASLAPVVVTSTAHGGQVLVVGSGSSPFPDVQSAVDAAIDGDIVLVGPGTYPGFVVPGKAISIVAEGDTRPQIEGGIRIRDLPAGRTVSVLFLDSRGAIGVDPAEGHGLHVENCAGYVRIEDCRLRGWWSAACFQPGGHGVEVVASAAVSIRRSECIGTSGVPRPATTYLPPGSGLVSVRSRVVLHGCTVTGGSGGLYCDGDYPNIDASSGAYGLQIAASELHAVKSTLRGGNGGFAQYGIGGDGASGMVWLTPGCVVRFFGTDVLGGFGGFGGYIPGEGAGDGTSASAGSTFEQSAWWLRDFHAPNVVRDTSSPQLLFLGEPNDHVALAISRDSDFRFDAARSGFVLTGGAPLRFERIGPMPDRFLLHPLPLPDLPIERPGTRLNLQCLFRDVGGQLWLGQPETMVILDATY